MRNSTAPPAGSSSAFLAGIYISQVASRPMRKGIREMVSQRRWGRLLRGLIVGLGVLLLIAPGSASATTGPTQFLHPPKYKVQSKLAKLYVGQYNLSSVVSSARLSGAAMGIEVDDHGALFGIGQFYGYDAHGYQSTWVGTLYNFHVVAKGEMDIQIVGQGGKPVLGAMYLFRSSHGDLRGQIQWGANVAGARYTISWHKLTH